MNNQQLKSDLLNSISGIEDTSILLELQTFLDEKTQRPKTKQEKETDLLLKINEGLDVELQERYLELSQKSVDENLIESEHQEFLVLIEVTETKAVQRLKYLIELSKLWNISVGKTMERLQISNPAIICA
jgi:predicted P-loop ATPase/GTPase